MLKSCNFNEHRSIKHIQLMLKSCHIDPSAYVVAGSAALVLQGILHRNIGDIDLIVMDNIRRSIVHTYSYDFCQVHRHPTENDFDIMTFEAPEMISKYFDARVNAYVQLYLQVIYSMQYVVDHHMTSMHMKRQHDINHINRLYNGNKI